MLDAAMMLMSSTLTACLWSGVPPKPRGNDLEYAGVSAYETKDGVLMLGSFRAGQHRRLWKALGRPDLAARSSVADQEEHREVFATALREVMLTRTAAEWESVPRGDPRAGGPHAERRRGARARAARRSGTCSTASRRFRTSIGRSRCRSPASGSPTAGPRVDTPPRALGADTDAVLGELGLTAAEIASLRQAHVV